MVYFQTIQFKNKILYINMEDDSETFYELKEFDNYMINKNGEIYSKKHKKVMKQFISNKGYYYLKIRKDNKSYSKLIHRLLGLQFLDNSNNLPLIDHKNRNKLDNNLNNLRWVTRSENCKNLGMREDREVKYIGVRKVKNKIKKPYRSETTFNNKKYHVGYFDSEEEAYEAYKKFNLEKFEIEII